MAQALLLALTRCFLMTEKGIALISDTGDGVCYRV